MSAGKLPPLSWLTAPVTRKVMAALEAAAPGGSRFVGGCVRNSLMGKPVDDVDIATRLEPAAVIAALEAAGLKAVPTGLAHGTVTGIADSQPFEITTLRRDVETDGRRAVVAFTDDWAEDAARRDFRLNAIYADADGVLHDPEGGVADARAGRVRFIGDASQRIREDALRILRYFRFLAWYGDAPDDVALAACAAEIDRLDLLSAERVWKELKKLLAAPDPRNAMRAMAQTGVLARLVPEAVGLTRFDGLAAQDADWFFEPDPLLRLMALLAPDPAAARALSDRLKLSGAERDRIVAGLGAPGRYVSWMSAREARRLLYRLGAAAFADAVRLAWALDAEDRRVPQWRALLALAAGWAPPTFPLGGDAVRAAGVRPGPAVGEVLREVEDWWVDMDFTDDRLSLIERLKAVAQAIG
jgi:poly(A) polymerase